jgi:hypothetical protein
MSSETPAVDDGTVKLGLLMETAHSHQELVDASLKRLQAHTQDLDQVLRDEIRRAFVAEFGALIDEGNRTADMLRSMRRAVSARLGWWAALIGVAPCIAVALVLAWWLPTAGQLAALRAEHQRLSAGVAQLAGSGGRIDLRRCGESERLCVRVDRHAPAYGEQADYLVVHGY